MLQNFCMCKRTVYLFTCCLIFLVSGCVLKTNQPDTEIWYITNNGQIVVPNVVIDSNPIVSNTIIDGKGILVFKEPLTVLPDSIFANVNSLIRIELPLSTHTIGSSAFYQCSNLQSISFSDNVDSIGTEAFWGCVSMKDISLPPHLTGICSGVFMNCSRLESITLPKELKSIGDNAFNGCHSLGGIITIPDGVVSIGTGIFANCKKIEGFDGKFVSVDGRCVVFNHSLVAFSDKDVYSYTIPIEVSTIYESVFSYSDLYEIILPNTIRSIRDYAFYRCANLSSINIPESVDSIGKDVFSFCQNLDSILVEGAHTYIESLSDHHYYKGPIVNYSYPENYITPPPEHEWVLGTWKVNIIGEGEIGFSFYGTGDEGTLCESINGIILEGSYVLSKEEDLIRVFLNEGSSYDIIEIHPDNRLYLGTGYYLTKQ